LVHPSGGRSQSYDIAARTSRSAVARKSRDATPARPAVANPYPAEEGECPAFGYLRGFDARALAIEFRFRNGNSEWLSYSLLASWR
jgi:hypothetical protein